MYQSPPMVKITKLYRNDLLIAEVALIRSPIALVYNYVSPFHPMSHCYFILCSVSGINQIAMEKPDADLQTHLNSLQENHTSKGHGLFLPYLN